jgi:transcriptional regulator with XRE-family HTH domain
MLHIKELRMAKKLNQEDLAKALNVAQVTISAWETGIREPDFEMLKKISAYFNVSTDYLLGNVKKPNQIVVEELKEIGVEWVEVAKDCVLSGVTPEDIKKIVEVFKNKK